MRFNLLLVSNDGQLGETVLKSLSKVYRDNFIFEVNSMMEAEKLYTKLNIDLLLVDLDSESADLVKLNEKMPHLQAMGISSYSASLTSRIDPLRHKLLRKQDLSTDLVDELKSIRKEKTEAPAKTAVRKSAPADTSEFRDFSSLVSSK